MANRYWVGGPGTWNTSTTNWSDTSGGTGGASAPTLADDVFFNNFSGGGAVTLTGSLTCKSLTTTGAPAFTFSGTGTLIIVGNLILVANITWSATGTVSINTLAADITLTVANAMSCAIQINPGVGRTVTLGSNLTHVGSFTWTSGNITIGAFNLRCGSFVSTVTNPRVITVSTGVITTTAITTGCNINGTQLTYSGTRPTINIDNATATALGFSAISFTQTNAFNVNVISGTYTLSVNGTQSWFNMNFTGFAGTWAPIFSDTLTIYGSLTMYAGGTYTPSSGVWTFAATTTGHTINGAGKNLGVLTFNGIGGGWTLGGALSVNGVLTFTNGTFNTGGFGITAFNAITYTAGTACTINLGSSTINISGSGVCWGFATPTNLTFNCGTSVMGFTNTAAKTFAGGGLTYGTVNFTSNGTVTNAITGNGFNTFANLNIDSIGTGVTTYTIDSNQTITGTLSATSANATRRMLIASSISGVQRTITAAAENINYCGFQDIAAAGAAIPWTGTNLGNYGNTANITFDTNTYYWIGATGTWSTTVAGNWATSTGGANSGLIPQPQNNVVFDVNSNTGTTIWTVTVAGPVQCNSLTASGLDAVMTLAGASQTLNIYGSLSLPATNFTFSMTGTINFLGTATNTISTNNINMPPAIVFNGAGTWNLGTAATLGAVSFARGTFNTANFALTATSATTNNVTTKVINLGSSAIVVTGFSTAWNFSVVTGLTFNAGTSTITVSQFLGVNFAGGGLTYNNVIANGTAGNAVLGLTGANTFANLTVTGGGRSITTDSNFTVTGTLTLTGIVAGTSRLFLKSNTVGTVRTVTAAAVSLTRVDFQFITAAGAIPWTGTSLGNSGNNTNITFTAAKNCYWNLAAGGNWNGNTSWALTPGGAVAAENIPLPQDTAFIVDTGLNAGATITLNNGETNGFMSSINASGRTLTAILNASIGNAFNGTWLLNSTIALSGNGTNAYSGSVINLNGATCTMPFTVPNSGTLTTTGAFVSGAALTVSSGGTLTLGVNSSSTTLTLAATSTMNFSTFTMSVTGSGTVFTGNGATTTGTQIINVTNATTTATTVSPGSASEANSISFVFSGGAYGLTISAGNFVRSLTLTSFVGTLANTQVGFYGNLTIPATGGTYTAGTNSWNFLGSGTQVITTNGRTLDWPMSQLSPGPTVQLAGALTLGATRTFTFLQGTLNLNNFALTSGLFVSSTANTRVIAFGTTGAITVIGSGIFFNMTGTSFTYTGTPTINLSNNSATGATITTSGAFTESNALNFNVTVGTYVLVQTSGNVYRNLNYTGFAGTINESQPKTYYGSLTLASGMTVTNTTTLTFAATSGTQTITSAGKTLGSITVSGIGGTVRFVDAAILSGTLTVANGTLSLPVSATTTVGTFATTGTTLKFLISSTPGTRATLSQATGTVTATYLSVKDSAATGGATFTATTNSVNAGNNTGWTFVSGSTGNFFLLF